jgi:hypothetical protein
MDQQINDNQAGFTAEEISSLIYGLGRFLEEECASLSLDDDHDRGTLAGKLAHWLLSDKTQLQSPEKILPKAKYRLGFNVVDEGTGEHIIRLLLDRTREMADGDFMQMQNWFWCTIGRFIRDNAEVRQVLEAGGVFVETDPPEGSQGGGQQFAT